MTFTVFFLSFTLISQNRNTVFTSLNYSNKQADIINDNLKIISIIDETSMTELKQLDQFASKYRNKNITFIAVTDNLNDSLHISCKDKLQYYQYLSENDNRKILNTYQTGMYKVFPIHVILNKEGKIIYKKKGSTENIRGKLAKRIDKLLNSYPKNSLTQEIEYTIR